MNETPIFASVERDLQMTYDDLAAGISENAATTATEAAG